MSICHHFSEKKKLISFLFSGIQCSSRIPLLQRPWTPGGLSNVRLFSRYVVIRVHVGQHDFPQRAILSRPRQLRSGKYWFLFPTSFRIYCLKFDEFWISFFCVNFLKFLSKISNHVVVVANQNSKFFSCRVSTIQLYFPVGIFCSNVLDL